MSFDGHQVMYRYNPNQRNDHGTTGDWVIDRYELDVSSSHDYDASTPSLMPMRRFIEEPERPLFNVAAQHHTATLPPFQSLDLAPVYPTTTTWPYSLGHDLPSPSLSGPSSSYFSSCASDRQSTPQSSPDSSFVHWSPEAVHSEHYDLNFGGGYEFSEQKRSLSYPCVALHEVQSYEDLQPEKHVYEEDTIYYGSYASAPHEGYHPVEPNGEVADSGVETDDNNSKDDDYTPLSPNLRHRRPQTTRAVTSPRAPSKVTKVTKSGHTRRRSSATQPKPTSNGCNSHTAAAPRAFPCALANYGCNSTFGSKNEWKRHVNTQHMRLGYWRCDQCVTKREHNDFNRKDLFIQHVRRMHPVATTTKTSKKSTKHADKPTKGGAEDQAFTALADRCFVQNRSSPDHIDCHFCDVTFEDTANAGQALWDKRLEHVAQHMENGKNTDAGTADPRNWRTDARLECWLLQNEIIKKAAGGGLVLA